jgi:hypothetical protein
VRSYSRAVAAMKPSTTVRGPSFHLTVSGQRTPAFGDRLAHRQDAAFKPGPQCLVEPPGNARLRMGTGHLRRDVGIEQKALHSSMSRPKSRSLSKSRSRPLNGESANN